MSGFDPAWLDLRTDADNAARDRGLLGLAVEHARAVADPLIVDLGTGAGANVRVLAPYLAHARWRLVDGDAALLAIAERRCVGSAVETCLLDLAKEEALPINDARLVTASALLDLVSAEWIDQLVRNTVAVDAAFYAVLSFDGLAEWSPAHPADAGVLAAFNAHQRTDKGFGPSLGGDAVAYARDRFAAVGYSVRMMPSPWRLGSKDAALVSNLIDGMAVAAAETGLLDDATLRNWREFRLAQAATGTCRIGHQDLFASPAA